MANHMHLADIFGILKEHDEDASNIVMDRASQIQNEKHQARLKDLAERANPLNRKFWGGVFRNFGLFPDFNARTFPRPRPYSLSASFGSVFENMRTAAAEYIIQNDVPLHHFDEAQQAYLFPNGIPSCDYDAAPAQENI